MIPERLSAVSNKAVGQYKKAKTEAAARTQYSSERYIWKESNGIVEKRFTTTKPIEKAKIKALEDYQHQNFYDYMDDGEYEIGNE